ncbi:5902_t:CDS:2, partial [Funneliformis mosseae]
SIEAAADLIFAKSRRQVPIESSVFQNQSLDYITKIVDILKLDLVQLHGDEQSVTQPGYNAFCLLDTKPTGVKHSEEMDKYLIGIGSSGSD